ncbi:MAG: hypothetical protein WBA23_13700 [Tunicatimonas sp.]|uniref:hypothetical protein n=1 Tax=Tunicatimonas sp. TaxID=1940096 RepID=UPI003C764678
MSTSNLKAITSPHQLLDYYLQMLHNAKVSQIKMFANWASVPYDQLFRTFLVEQQQVVLQQYDSLKSLEGVFNVLFPGGVCRPVNCLLHEADQVAQLSGSDIGLAEPLLMQLVQCIKQYEITTARSAITLAYSIKEQKIANMLATISLEDSEAFLQLQNLLNTYWRSTEPVYSTEIEA